MAERSLDPGATLLAQGGAAAAVLLVGAEPAAGAPLTRTQERALRAAVRGRVLTPATSGYDAARVVFNRRFDGVKPPAVVQVRDSADVRAVVRWADRYDAAARRALGRARLQRQLDERDRRGGRPRRARPHLLLRRQRDARPRRADARRLHVAVASRRHDPRRARRSRSAGSCSVAGWGSRDARWASRSTASRASTSSPRTASAAASRTATTCSGRCAAAAGASRS